MKKVHEQRTKYILDSKDLEKIIINGVSDLVVENTKNETGLIADNYLIEYELDADKTKPIGATIINIYDVTDNT